MATDKTTILVVEDEPAIVELISYSLREAGWHPVVVGSSTEAWTALNARVPHLVLLDWMLPDHSGLRLLSRIRSDRQFSGLPVIMLTAKSMEEDKIAGLDQGADDYITKPFSPRELTARIKALLRRKAPERGQDLVTVGNLILDPASFSVSISGQRIEMGNAEFKLLRFLMTHANRVFSRTQLLDKVWGTEVVIEERTVDVHILRLRKALGDAGVFIKTIRSVGYMFSEK